MHEDRNKTIPREGDGDAPVEVLKTELEYFAEIKDRLLARDRGRFAVIQGRTLSGCWDTYADAIQDGYAKFGLGSFLVKQVLEVEPVHRIFCLSAHTIGIRDSAA